MKRRYSYPLDYIIKFANPQGEPLANKANKMNKANGLCGKLISKKEIPEKKAHQNTNKAKMREPTFVLLVCLPSLNHRTN